jgi:hypothetical protein
MGWMKAKKCPKQLEGPCPSQYKEHELKNLGSKEEVEESLLRRSFILS